MAQPWTRSDAAAVAGFLLHRADLERHPTELNPFALCDALGIKLDPAAVPGCDGVYAGPRPDGDVTILVDEDESEAVTRFGLAHELLHFGCECTGRDRPHGETFCDRGAAAMLVSCEAASRALDAVGWHAERLVARFPNTLASVVLERVALVGGGIAILYRGGQRIVHARFASVVPPNPQPWEQLLVDHVCATGRPRQFDGTTGAWVLPDYPGAEPGIVVLASPKACFDSWGRQIR